VGVFTGQVEGMEVQRRGGKQLQVLFLKPHLELSTLSQICERQQQYLPT
jgi:hypothetical protein